MKPRWLLFLGTLASSLVAALPIGCGSSPPTAPKVLAKDTIEFRILANTVDDLGPIENARKVFTDDKRKAELDKLAQEGKAPPPPLPNPDERAFPNNYTYSWVPMTAVAVRAFEQANGAKEKSADWQRILEAQAKGMPVVVLWPDQALVYSHKSGGGVKYFYLTINPLMDKEKKSTDPYAIDGRFLESVSAGVDSNNQPVINVTLNKDGAERLYNRTLNLEAGADAKFFYSMAVLVKGEVVSVLRITTALHKDCQLTGPFTPDEVAKVIKTLKGE